ncbi:MAG: VTT domain-containing protein [Candidatus Micrarchaeia archaeon]|jgi:membrane protein YqaA with SNARE-associated domain
MGEKPIIGQKDALALAGAALISVLAIFLFSRVQGMSDLGYAGVFAISLVSSATIFAPMPGFAIVFAMGAFLNPALVGIAAGIGSGIGELSGYLAGYAGHGAVMRTKLFRQHKEGVVKYGPLGIFALAFVPNPIFDIAGIASGAIKMPVWQFLAATICGKALRYVLLAFAGDAAYGFWQWG